MNLEDLDELVAAEPVKRGRPSLRQPPAPTSAPLVKSDSWWMTYPERSGFTARAEAERERMAQSVIGRSVPHQIMGRYTGLVRPAE